MSTAKLASARQAVASLHAHYDELETTLREVDAVAAKTKLLGFNASLLAAQAGTEGRSFAVVAEQMKTLNQRAEASTRKLHALLELVRSGTQTAERALGVAESPAP